MSRSSYAKPECPRCGKKISTNGLAQAAHAAMHRRADAAALELAYGDAVEYRRLGAGVSFGTFAGEMTRDGHVRVLDRDDGLCRAVKPSHVKKVCRMSGTVAPRGSFRGPALDRAECPLCGKIAQLDGDRLLSH